MGMMDHMMQGMIKAYPVEERKALLLQMMPDMMKDTDLVKMMPLMLKKMGQIITLYALYNFIATALKDEELKSLLKEKLDSLKESMPEMMEMMMPVMHNMMSEFMPKMMKHMSPMMPMMAGHMPQMMNEKMIPMLEQNPDMKENMLTMMQTVFPHCAANMFPLIEKDKREVFIDKLKTIMTESADKEEK